MSTLTLGPELTDVVGVAGSTVAVGAPTASSTPKPPPPTPFESSVQGVLNWINSYIDGWFRGTTADGRPTVGMPGIPSTSETTQTAPQIEQGRSAARAATAAGSFDVSRIGAYLFLSVLLFIGIWGLIGPSPTVIIEGATKAGKAALATG